MTCFIKELELSNFFTPESKKTNRLQVIDYDDGHWGIQIGEYGAQFTAMATTADIYKLTEILVKMTDANAEREAVATADYETEPKDDERNTEAWLDKEG